MATFTERMIGAARLDRAIFEEIEADPGATSQAMLVVVGAAVAAGIGAARAGQTAIVWGVVAALVGWCIWAGLTYFIGATVMPEPQTHADFGQLLRTIGFAATPGLLQVLGFLPVLGGLVTLVGRGGAGGRRVEAPERQGRRLARLPVQPRARSAVDGAGLGHCGSGGTSDAFSVGPSCSRSASPDCST